ncbi:hypothetical protein GM418_11620 [Maribellus comscasis]|uniref:Uncharacterized protein n=1 Tax=Maribellus comscasis TaxID=2681766 RepID=A0A6I6JT45_9BACT|nr:hypothetical protein [Maribellus comscasis]QGY44280.1 hypothetical protein GM418_11620 [Maribellus comscasis]
MNKLSGFILLIAILTACTQPSEFDSDLVNKALENGKQANEGFIRSLDFVNGWLTKTDSITGLIPTNLTNKTDVWEAHNSAADNYAFMVLTAFILDKELYHGAMLDMLNTEQELTSRVESLPDTWSFSKQNFASDELKMGDVIFGTSEYIKDGLIPLNEYIGESPWQDRMMEMLDDLAAYMKEVKDLERYFERTASIEEVNGEMLQTLSRVYWMTGDQKYLEWAIRIGDYYLLGDRDLTQTNYLRIRDHGCEIIGGLSELYVTAHFANPQKKGAYKLPFYALLDRVLEVGRNEDGLFYNAVNPKTGEIADSNIVDNWGYVFDAYYSVYLVDGKEEYREAVLKGFQKLNEKYRDYAWEGTSHDGYADALESGINLYNREPVPELKNWIDSEMQVMFNMQQDDGIIGGWHGDGNFARTAIMYSLWKTRGATLQPWRKDVILGAEQNDGQIYFVITAEKDWTGKLVFDTQRHKTILNLPIDYPRINQFPEWFTANEGENYTLTSSQKELTGTYPTNHLPEGIPVKVAAGETLVIAVKQNLP